MTVTLSFRHRVCMPARKADKNCQPLPPASLLSRSLRKARQCLRSLIEVVVPATAIGRRGGMVMKTAKSFGGGLCETDHHIASM